ncbi:MAG: hypothetical protein CVV24_03250 [Ignavibacteriae bacterium HGW-Ignavibacteriae-3]|nr:MAG: hypothetical protein CVV24_03250 [Ignavibacteriae bacterium HGW-Ignavibacteriae-3]
MKKYTIKIALLFLFLAIMVGCGKKESSQNAASINPDNLQSVDVSGQKIYLKYQFAKDDKLHYKLTTITNTLQTIKADSLLKSSAVQTLTYFFDINVVETDANNVAELAVNIASINFAGDINGQKMSYDSKKVTKEDKDKFAEFEVIVNSPFRVRVNQKGEILDVTRVDKMIDKMISIRPEMKEMTSDQKSSMMKNIIEGELKPRTQLLFREMTSVQVAKDSTWKRSTPASLAVFQIENTSNFKVDDFIKVGDDRAAKLSATLTSKWSGEKKGSEEGMNFLFDDPKVTGGGTIIFNIDRGLLIKSETSTTVELGVQIDSRDATQKMRKTVRKDLSTNKNIVELL